MKIRTAGIFFSGIFILFVYLSLKTPMYADDYVFARIPFSDAFMHAVNLYFTWGGRILGNFWSACMNTFPACIAAICSSFFLCSIFVSIHFLTYGTDWKKNLSLDQVCLAIVVFYLFLPDAWEISLWRTGTYYTMGAAFACLFLIPYRFLLDGKNVFSRRPIALLFILFSFSVPFWVEVVIAPVLFLGALCLFVTTARKQAGFWPVAAYIVFFSGSAATLFAPGNVVRAEASMAFDSAVFIRTAAVLAFKYSFTVLFPSLLFLLFACTAHCKNTTAELRRIWKTGACLFLASLFSAAILLGSGTISYRALSFSFILLLPAVNMAYGQARQRLPLLKGVPLALLGAASFWAILTCMDYTRVKEAELQRTRELAARVSAREKTAFLQEYPRIRQRNFAFLDSLRGNPRPWAEAVASAYGMEHTYLLMDSAPETLDEHAGQRWQGELKLSSSLTLCSVLVAERGDHKVLAAAFSGDAEQIKELLFLTVAEDSSVRAKLAQLLLSDISLPEIVTSLPRQFLGELLDRTTIVPAPNTLRRGKGTAVYYAKLHPLAEGRGPLKVSLRIKTDRGAIMARIPL